MDDVTHAEFELIRAKVREGTAAAARGEHVPVDDAFMDDLFRRAQERASQRSRDLNA
jgi:predicted transcriptional regulator